MIARAFAFLTNAFLAALVLGAALPGPHRVACPECFGLTAIAPHVWTDAPKQRPRLLDLLNSAESKVAGFFGDTPTRPNVILCAKKTCAETFGIGGNGLSVPRVAIMVSPGGLTTGTLTHEMSHARLHRAMGPRNLIRQPYPTWFDEGLSTFVADHPRWSGSISAADRARVRETQHFWQWSDTMRELGVGRAYRAAAAEVAQIEDIAGRRGLLELIHRAEAGEDFEKVMTSLING